MSLSKKVLSPETCQAVYEELEDAARENASRKYRNDVLQSLNGYGERKTWTHAALGISGEAGEVTDIVKKNLVFGKPLDRKHLIEELGDVRWYLELFCILLDVSINEVEAGNIDKLKRRFPDAFKE